MLKLTFGSQNFVKNSKIKAGLLEPLAVLWIHLAFTIYLKRDFAFQIKRE
jgi:hypothetical protein